MSEITKGCILQSNAENEREKKRMTNYERIKNMSVYEMAEFINGVTSSVAVKLNCEYVSNDIKYIKQWLEMEVEE